MAGVSVGSGAPIVGVRLRYRRVGINVLYVTDPFLLSGADDLAGPAPVDRVDELARRMGMPRSSLAGTDDEMLDRLEWLCDRSDEHETAWGGLADQVDRELIAAGFMRHNPMGHRGGFCLSLWDDGVLLAWSTTEYEEDTVSPFEKMVSRVMHPAIDQILQATGFGTRLIPDGEDNAGCIMITSWRESAVAE